MPAAFLSADQDDLLKVAEELDTEAEVIDDDDFQSALRSRAAELYREYAAQVGSEKAATALLKACDQYIKINNDEALSHALVCTMLVMERFGSSKVAPDSLALRGEIYAQKKQWGRAVKSWIACADTYPQSGTAPQALFRAGQVFQKYIRNPGEAERQYARVIATYTTSDVTDDCLFNRAGVVANCEKYEEAIADYLNLAKQFPASELADKAMYEAAVLCDEELKDYKRAYDLAVEFRQAYPHSALLKKMERIEAKTLKYVKDS